MDDKNIKNAREWKRNDSRQNKRILRTPDTSRYKKSLKSKNENTYKKKSNKDVRQSRYKSNKGNNMKKRKRRIILFILEAILVLIMAVVLIFNYYWNKLDTEETLAPEATQINEIDKNVEVVLKGYRNIAVFGVDARNNTTLDKGTLADAIMIVSINRETKDIKIVSVYRDTYLNTRGESTFNKINTAYSEGGPSQALYALNRNLDLDIKEYVTVNWKAVVLAVDILGGVEIDVPRKAFPSINGYITETVKATAIGSVQLKQAGLQKLDGIQAVAYSRLRYIDDDYRRTERQREVVEQMLMKAKEADATTLMRLVDAVFPQIKTNIRQTDALELALDIMRYKLKETSGFPYDKNSRLMGAKGDCVIPLGLAQNVQQLHEFLFENEAYKPSATVLQLDKKIKNDTGFGNPGEPTTAVWRPSSTAEAQDNTEDGSNSEVDSEGNIVNPTTREPQTDENGDIIPILSTSESETDESGRPIESSPVTSTGEDGTEQSTSNSMSGQSPLETSESSSAGEFQTIPSEPYPIGPGSSEMTQGTTAPPHPGNGSVVEVMPGPNGEGVPVN